MTATMNTPLEAGKKEKRPFEMEVWWEERTIPQKVLFVLSMILLAVVLLAVFGWVVMLLWNWLMPPIFHLGTITYWQAWGLLILSSILFKPWNMNASSGSSDRKRKRELRKYMREQESDPSEEQC